MIAFAGYMREVPIALREGREMSAPNLDRSGRRRSVHVTFRMSPEEAAAAL